MSKILENLEPNNLKMEPVHILKLNLKTYKLTVSATNGYADSDNYIIMPKLKSSIQFNDTSVKEHLFKTSTLTNGETLNIFVLDIYNSKKSIFAEDKPTRLQLYKLIISEILRLLIGNLTVVYRKTNSIDIGEEINQLTSLYTAYSR